MASVSTLLPKKQPQAGTVAWFRDNVARGEREVFSQTTRVTPGLASAILANNADNRNIRITKSAQYAADMRAGRWEFNGEPIIVSSDGQLNDGQHRLFALIEANISLPFLFVFGVSRDSRLTVDQGGAKSASDYLAMQGIPNPANQASISRLLLSYERNGGTSLKNIGYVTNGEVIARVSADGDIATSATFATTNARFTKAFAAPAVIGFCHYVFSEISPDEAHTYMTQVCRGEGLSAKDPAYTVRDRLLNLETKSRERRIHIIFRGWNAFRHGRKLAIAKIAGGDNIPAAI